MQSTSSDHFKEHIFTCHDISALLQRKNTLKYDRMGDERNSGKNKKQNKCV